MTGKQYYSCLLWKVNILGRPGSYWVKDVKMCHQPWTVDRIKYTKKRLISTYQTHCGFHFPVSPYNNQWRLWVSIWATVCACIPWCSRQSRPEESCLGRSAGQSPSLRAVSPCRLYRPGSKSSSKSRPWHSRAVTDSRTRPDSSNKTLPDIKKTICFTLLVNSKHWINSILWPVSADGAWLPWRWLSSNHMV